MVNKKIEDYKIEGFLEMLDSRIDSLKEIVYGDAFSEEMKRFLAQEVFDSTLATDKFKAYMLLTLTNILLEVKKGLANTNDNEPEFRCN